MFSNHSKIQSKIGARKISRKIFRLQDIWQLGDTPQNSLWVK